MSQLTKKIRADMEAAFREYDHCPSAAMWEAIEDVADNIEKMASGTASKVFYVSSLDPGVGKTQTVVHSVRNLPKSVGTLICVSHKAEITKLQNEMGLTKDETGIYTADPTLNETGANDLDKARVLFTTQQMVDSRLKGGAKFKDLDVFHFHGKPRAVRIWDESMLPGEELTLSVFDLSCIPAMLRKADLPLKERLVADAALISKLPDGSTYQFPDIEAEYGLDLIDKAIISERIRGEKETRRRDILSTFYRLSGKTVNVVRDAGGNTVLDYVDHLSDDFTPVLILDASARIRTTYAHWAQCRGNLVPLKQAFKRYDNLTVHHWNTGGGKDSWRRNPERLVDGIAATINSKPDEQWLVVIHKDEGSKDGIPDLRDPILDLVKGDRDRVKFLTWGNHHATNEYVAVENVILAGTLFFPPSVIAVRTRASKALRPSDSVSKDDSRKTELGEHANLILQALCRGSVRTCIGDTCAPCNGYLIAAERTGITADFIKELFPRCKTGTWQPVDKPTKGKIKDALDLLDQAFEGKSSDYALSFAVHQGQLGITDRANYNRTIRQHPDFVSGCRTRGIAETILEGWRYTNHYTRKTTLMTEAELDMALKAMA